MNATDGNSQNNVKRGDAGILVTVLAIFGLVLGGVGLHRYNRGRESASWPTAQGKIIYSRAEPHKVDTGHHYMPSVKYTYTVDGKLCTGRGITASDEYEKTLSGANDLLRQYAVGTKVSVFYAPDDPSRSVLETGIRKNVYVLLAGAALCFLFALAVLISAIKSKRHRTADAAA